MKSSIATHSGNSIHQALESLCSRGIDKGFDLYPPLQNTPGDNRLYADFVLAVHTTFRHDPIMKIDNKGFTIFEQGEAPCLTRDGQHFRRFAAKVSGRSCGFVEFYIDAVYSIAVEHFGTERVHTGLMVVTPQLQHILGQKCRMRGRRSMLTSARSTSARLL